ncbi:DUF4147 domain-containing protein [Profundibacterium mesophilum]|uniref:DUF4147 domain-containing protein n=1 Tax=Profundibacterium mesophilum TaxID=1258573 RepID=UPI0022A6A60E|nr:DUF4147 domain-containing protein [Profundibacterium mesophilum]
MNRLLLASGLSISAMNSVRRRLSRINGGGLAQAAEGARIVTLAIPDVPGDDPAAIASGPTVADPTAGDDLSYLSYLAERLGSGLPDVARRLLSTSSPARPDQSEFRFIAIPQASLQAAVRVAEARGITPILLGDALEREARELGIDMAAIASSVARNGTPAPPPAVLMSGGEPAVTIRQGSPGPRIGRSRAGVFPRRTLSEVQAAIERPSRKRSDN